MQTNEFANINKMQTNTIDQIAKDHIQVLESFFKKEAVSRGKISESIIYRYRTGGHHQTYLKALMDISGKENVLVLPEKIEGLNAKQYVFRKTDFFNKKLLEYYKWTKEVKGIIKTEKPNVVHFLYGDVFYKYFGLGLEGLKKKYKVINTIHALKKGKIGIVSLKRVMHLSSIGVVHTDAIFNEVKDAGIENVVHIEYPHFSTGYDIDKVEHGNIIA